MARFSKTLIFAVILGFGFRFIFNLLYPQPFLYDQLEYARYAENILKSGLYAESARLYGYPLFLAFIFKIFGVSTFPVFILQAFLDSVVAAIVYSISLKLMRNRLAALLSCGLYIFNPLTSAFTPLILTESLTIFLIPFVYILLLIVLRRKSFPVMALLFFVLGYLPQVRPSFFIFSLILLMGLWIFHFSCKLRPALLGYIMVFLLPFAYTVWGNLAYYQKATFLTVDNLFIREMYLGFFPKPEYPERKETESKYPEIGQIYREYSSGNTNEERKKITQKYEVLIVHEFQKNPFKNMVLFLGKLWQVWEKHYILLYSEQIRRTALIYNLNMIFLGTGVLGIIGFGKKEYHKLAKTDKLYTFSLIFLFIYISFFHLFSAVEDRYSLPAYSLVCVFSGYGLFLIMKMLQNLIKKKMRK